jgi:hypothetical protein
MVVKGLKLLTVLFCVLNCTELFSQNFNRPVPPGVFPYEFRQYNNSNTRNYLLSPFGFLLDPADPAFVTPKPVILDKDGYLLWYMNTDARSTSDFKYFPAFSRYGYISFSANGVWYKFLDSAFNPVDSVHNSTGIEYDTHELLILKNGDYVIGGEKDSIFDLSAYTFNGKPGSAQTHAMGYVVEEFDQDHKLVFQWNANDYIHPSMAYEQFGYDANSYDYCHGNAIAETADGNFLVSLRHLNAIYKIDRKTGNIIWRLGGKASDFTFMNDVGFSGQHDVREQPNGDITLYDNANTTPGNPTRAVEYSIDTINHKATKVWEYRYAPLFFARAMGNHQVSSNGFRLINSGLIFRPNPTLTLIDPNSQPVADIFLKDSVISYRSYIFDLPSLPSKPTISCSRINGKLILSAPGGFAKYMWQTGETTQSIEADTTGEYQVWVNYGIGMLGSKPYAVKDLSTACVTGIPDGQPKRLASEITEIYNLLGQKITNPRIGTLYIVQRKDGSSQLTYWNR